MTCEHLVQNPQQKSEEKKKKNSQQGIDFHLAP